MMRKREVSLLVFLFVFCAWPGRAGESEQAQPYEKIRYPTFDNGRLKSILEADQAVAYDLAEGTPRINLRNVAITLYDHSEESLKNTPDDQPLRAKMTITSDRGYFIRRPPEPGGQLEEIANLEGNVVLRQMRLDHKPAPATSRSPRLPPEVETEIRCEHAQWNNSLGKLNGDGEVVFLQEDSRIVGTGFLYLADDEAMDKSSGGAPNFKEWGGIVFIEHNARMEIDREALSGPAGGADDSPGTVITCKDTASYKLREREIQFENDVKISREDLTMESDILKVFLRREEDMEDAPPSRPCGDKFAPGQVKNMVATIGKRAASVVINGFEKTPAGEKKLQYTARGGRADFDYDANRITLTDSRTGGAPQVEFGDDRISDRTLEFVFQQPEGQGDCNENSPPPAAPGGGGKTPKREATLESLNASGGQGQVLLRSSNPAEPTEVTYKSDMNYSRAENRIRFRGTVFLKQGDFRIRADTIDAKLSPNASLSGQGGRGAEVGANQIERITAQDDVSIQAGNREARAQRAEYEMHEVALPGGQKALYTLRLYGPPQRTPPHPWVRDEQGNQVTAPEIHMQRLERDKNRPNDRDRHLIRATGGVAVCDFHTSPGNLSEKQKVISIKSEKGMEFNEATGVAWFEGQVMATSDAPEDNYVLTSDRLNIKIEESPDPKLPGEVITWVRRIDASGNARLMQDTRVCEAIQIIRDFPTMNQEEGDIYLEGAPARDGRPPRMAVYREQNGAELGAVFAAPRIKASAKGDLIQANGPGQLSMPGDVPGLEQRSEITFAGAARYESFHDGMASEAKFRKTVVLRQPSRKFILTSEELDARFLNERPGDVKPDEDAARIALERIGTLRRAEARVNVRVEHALPRQGNRVATGDRGIIEFTNNGNVISMTADRKQGGGRGFVIAKDHDGMTLISPQIEVREQQGITRAAGPGELQIPGDPRGEGMSKVPTRVLYGERGVMVYNELALNIKASDNVRVVQAGPGGNWTQPSLDGRCDRMEISLIEPPEGGMSSQEALSRVKKMDALGAVLLRVYADPPPDNPNVDWLNRPGTTFFTRGDQGEYFVADGRIVISGLPGRQPQLLLNMVDPGSPPRRQRLKADRFVLNTNTVPRRWFFEGQLESNTLKSGEAFEFQD